MEMLVPVDGGEVWAEDSGTGSVTDSGADLPVLVLLHSGVGDSRQWDPLLPLLSPRYRTIRYDVRGYGRSARPAVPFTMLGDLTAVLDHLGLDRVGLVGCSQGGATAIDAALAHPHRVAGMVLLAPGLSGHTWPPDPEYYAAGVVHLKNRDLDGLLALVARKWAGAGLTPPVEDQLRSLIEGWFDAHELMKPNPSAVDRLEEVSVPATLMVGDRDWPPLIELDERIAARIPGCKLVHLPGADHFPQHRAPEAIAAAIDETLVRTAWE